MWKKIKDWMITTGFMGLLLSKGAAAARELLERLITKAELKLEDKKQS